MVFLGFEYGSDFLLVFPKQINHMFCIIVWFPLLPPSFDPKGATKCVSRMIIYVPIFLELPNIEVVWLVLTRNFLELGWPWGHVSTSTNHRPFSVSKHKFIENVNLECVFPWYSCLIKIGSLQLRNGRKVFPTMVTEKFIWGKIEIIRTFVEQNRKADSVLV